MIVATIVTQLLYWPVATGSTHSMACCTSYIWMSVSRGHPRRIIFLTLDDSFCAVGLSHKCFESGECVGSPTLALEGVTDQYACLDEFCVNFFSHGLFSVNWNNDKVKNIFAKCSSLCIWYVNTYMAATHVLQISCFGASLTASSPNKLHRMFRLKIPRSI